MVKSKHNTFGFWFHVGIIALYIFLTICCITQYYYHFTIMKIHIPNQRSFNGWMIINAIACLIFGAILYSRACLIEINSDSSFLKTITFKNLFSRQTKTYSFEEFDGYISTRLWHKQFNENKTLCLIKEGRVFRKIDNFFYSNVDELQQGLKEMKYLGFKRMGFRNSWKVLFNQPIIKC
jgi:hypothetical protein